ncbi:MAG: hypothetical protein HY756_12325 [Nitrospirae bacterium]|nr:hypothetical protein [Nitrospirota bacterium]
MKNKSVITLNNAYKNIKAILEKARAKSFKAVNTAMVQAYWHIGKVIVEEEQKGAERAEYGRTIIEDLAKRLTSEYGKGFNKTNLWYMRQFYLAFQNLHAVRGELTWTHYRLLLKVENPKARAFYETEMVNAQWSTRELERQICSLLFERLALSRDKKGVLELAKKGHHIASPPDIVKDPYVLEFLGLEKHEKHSVEFKSNYRDEARDV